MRISSLAQRTLAEALGTFILVFVGSGTACAATLLRAAPGLTLLLVAFGLGLALFVGIIVVGKVSGGHYNPAVTLGLAVTGRFDWSNVPWYLIGQVVGCILGALCILIVYGQPGAHLAGLGAPALAPRINLFQGLVIEGLGTAILMLTIMGSAVDTRGVAGWAPYAIGLTLLVVILFIGPATGGSVNPARAFGPDIVAIFFGFPVNWAAFIVSYLIGPLLGAALAAWVYSVITGLPRPEVAAVGGARPQAQEASTAGDDPDRAGVARK